MRSTPSPAHTAERNAVAIEIEDLHVSFTERGLLRAGKREVRALDGVSLQIRRGEVFCIAGESGSGKTTLGRAILGLVPPGSGHLTVEGRDLGSLRSSELRALRRRVQMIFQDPMGSLNPRQSVYEAVAEAVRVHDLPGDEPALVAEALARAGLRPPERFFLSYPHELSGGQRQRVVIASALVLQPHVLVADEPVSMLDASVRGEILKLLVDLQRQAQLTLVLITHDLGFAWALADRVAVMYMGKIMEIGPTEQVLTRPLHPYTRALLSVSPEIGERKGGRHILTGEVPDPSRVPPGCRFHPRCPEVLSGRAGTQESRCRGEVPELRDLAEGQRVACHLAPHVR